jgi:hypothetical protein
MSLGETDRLLQESEVIVHGMADTPTLNYERQLPMPRRKLTACSYCGRTNRETGPQVEGPWKLLRGRAYICARCDWIRFFLTGISMNVNIGGTYTSCISVVKSSSS